MIPFNRATFDGAEMALMAQAVAGGHISGNGPFTRRAEEILAEVHGGGRSLLTTSCTHALELCARLMNFEPGDEVIVPAFTFVSTAAAFMLHGARPVFVDVRDDTLNADADLVEAAMTERTKAVCVVHYAGVAAEPDRFRRMADDHGVVLVEDNAHGLFGAHRGRPLGTFGEMSTMSFHETKNVTCGEGGALHLNDASFSERAEILRDKGTNRSRFLRGQVDKYTWVDVGSSWVSSDLLAAVLVGQLERRAEIQSRRMHVWNTYNRTLCEWARDNGFGTPVVPEGCEHPAHTYFLRAESLQTRTRFIEHMRAKGILAVFHYQPLHLSEVGASLGGRAGQHPVAEEAGDCLVRLPLFAGLTDDEIDRVVEAVLEFR